jgi:hypothetical protein
MKFVIDVPPADIERHLDDVDVYRPAGTEPLPTAIIVPGPSPEGYVPPREWPVYVGYGRLLASRGVAAVVLDLPYHDISEWSQVSQDLPGRVEAARALDDVDPTRIAIWAWSGGAMLVGSWLAESPEWLRGMALTYPVLATPEPKPMPADAVRPGRPLVLTKVGKERPDWQASVDRFLATAADTGAEVHVIEVPEGQHGFDVLDHTEESRQAVLEATDFVVENLQC